jgi:hypothetical protein
VNIRYRHTDTINGYPDRNGAYEVRVQDRPRGRWTLAGWVVGLADSSGPNRPKSWIALPSGPLGGWTHYRPTRRRAVADMLAGQTWFNSPADPQDEDKR